MTVGEAMVAVELSEGEHLVKFEYRNKAFSLGWKISLACLLIFVVVTLVYLKNHPKRGKYQK